MAAASMSKPFLRWAGSKTALAPEILPLLGFDDRGTYHEPFLGSGAVFFAIAPSKAVLSDMNADLVCAFLALRDYPKVLFERLHEHERRHLEFGDGYYYTVRSLKSATIDRVWTEENLLHFGSRFLYLNRAGFNGLWRVNKKGEMNTPIGKDRNKRCIVKFNTPLLTGCSELLQNADIRHCSYERSLDNVKEGDRVYCDPPYVPIDQATNFSAYASDFPMDLQLDLLHRCKDLGIDGATVVLSNSFSPVTEALYIGCTRKTVQINRSIAANRADRKVVREFLISF